MVLYARIDDLDVWADWFANGLGGPEALLVGLDLALARAAGSAGQVFALVGPPGFEPGTKGL